MQEDKRTYKRKKYYVKKSFQARFILIFGVLVLVGGFFSTGLVIYFSHGDTTALFSNSQLKIFDTASFLLPAIIYSNLITIIFISLSIMVMVLFVSHKIAGPLFRFEKDIKTIGDGDLTYKICLRKDDQLKKLSCDINEMTEGLNLKLEIIKSDIKRCMNSAEAKTAPEWFQRELNGLYNQINQQFKTSTIAR